MPIPPLKFEGQDIAPLFTEETSPDGLPFVQGRPDESLCKTLFDNLLLQVDPMRRWITELNQPLRIMPGNASSKRMIETMHPIMNRTGISDDENTSDQPTVIAHVCDVQRVVVDMLQQNKSTLSLFLEIALRSEHAQFSRKAQTIILETSKRTEREIGLAIRMLFKTIRIAIERDPDRSPQLVEVQNEITERIPHLKQFWNAEPAIVLWDENTNMHRRQGKQLDGQTLFHTDLGETATWQLIALGRFTGQQNIKRLFLS